MHPCFCGGEVTVMWLIEVDEPVCLTGKQSLVSIFSKLYVFVPCLCLIALYINQLSPKVTDDDKI